MKCQKSKKKKENIHSSLFPLGGKLYFVGLAWFVWGINNVIVEVLRSQVDCDDIVDILRIGNIFCGINALFS